MALAWQCIEQLIIMATFTKTPPRAMLQALHSLAQHCLALSFLEMNFDASTVPKLKNSTRRMHQTCTTLLHAVTSRLFLLPPPPPPKPPCRGVEDGFFEVGTTESQAGIRLASCRRGLKADPGWAAGRIGQRWEGGGARVDRGSKTETRIQGIAEYFCTPPVMSSALRPADVVLAWGAHILRPFDLPKVGFGLGGGPARHYCLTLLLLHPDKR
ncbi:hypothetical protein B0H10DRAFT_2187170 [Mycena sp. CBHHK59/15]|nr:hypothetical protein B0H10DRAFT_2187170 [Mycena sp. CBHHK59/15]